MNRFKMSIQSLFIGMVMLAGCDDAELVPGIQVENQEVLAQTAYADETSGTSGVSFVTTAAWTSSISEGTEIKATRAGTDSWVSIDPDHGDAAGKYTITITLEPNYTGQTRSATIEIMSSGNKITVAVTQTGTTESGEVPQDPNTGTRILTYDGKAYPVVKTEFVSENWIDPSSYIHRMKFYVGTNHYILLSLVTDRQEFSGGSFTFGDTQVNGLNKATGNIRLPDAAGGTGYMDEMLEWGSPLRAVRQSDNTLVVEFNNVSTNVSNKPVSFSFSGAFENTDYGSDDGGFVPVERIDFASSAHILLALQANLNAVCQLSEAVVFPQNATNKQIEWTAQGATINGSSLVFDQAGTATVTATIQRGALNADGNQASYTRTWTVTVGGGSSNENAIIISGIKYSILNAEFSAGAAMANGLYQHTMKFYKNSAEYIQMQFVTAQDVFAGGMFATEQDLAAIDLNEVWVNLNFITATGASPLLSGGSVTTNRSSANVLTMDFSNISTADSNNPVSFHFEGAYAITDPGGGTDPNPNPEQMITFSGTEYPIVKTEFSTQSWTSADGSVTAKCQKMRFYINSARYAEVTIVSNADELATDQYIFGNIGSNDMVGKAEGIFNFTTATGATDYAVAGGKVRVVRDPDGSIGSIRVEFMYDNVTTMAANLPIRLLYVGAYGNTVTGPEKPTLGNMYVNQTPYNLTGCEVSYNYQTQIARVEFTGKECDLWFETYLQDVDEAQPPMLNGTFTVKYLDPDGTNWGERFNNMAFAAHVHAVGPHSDWGDWQSGLREGTQIRVNMNTQKINVGIQNADINGVDDGRKISLEYDNAYTRK